MKLLLLGGSGLQAESIALDLLSLDSENIDEITLAARNTEKLKKRVASINSSKVRWEAANIDDHDALVKLMQKHDLVFNAANTPTVYQVIKAVLSAGVNLVGLEGVNQHIVAPDAPCDEFGFVKQSFFDELDEQFKKAGISAVLGWGYVPGITNFLGRMIGDRFDTIDSMTWNYATASRGDRILFTETPREMIWLFRQEGVKFKDGKYLRFDPKKERDTVDFPEPIGKVTVQHMSYMPTVPVFADKYANKNIQNIDVRLGYWAGYIEMMDFLDSVGMLDDQPKNINGIEIAPVDVFISGPGVTNKEGLQLKDYGCVRLDVNGMMNNHQTSCTANVMAYPMRNLGAMQILTGIPAAIGIQMFVTKKISKKGFYTTMDESIDPKAFFKELSRRKFTLEVSIKETIEDGRNHRRPKKNSCGTPLKNEFFK